MATIELTDAEVRLLIEAVESRLEHLMSWDGATGVWSSLREREVALKPLEDLVQRLMSS